MAGVTASFVCSFVVFILSTLLSPRDVLAQERRSCPAERFCRIGADCTNNITSCVTVCPTETEHRQQGNWISGKCEEIPQGTIHWMDSTFYEVFILTNQTVNTPIRSILFISSETFKTNNLTYTDLVDDITFTLNGSCPYFYFANMSKSKTVFENYYDLYVPDTIEMTELTLAEPVPPDDYEMQLSVTSSDEVLETRDIVVHVTRDPPCPEPPCPVQDTSVAFTSSNYIVSESAGLLVVTLESSGTIQSQSFTVYVIVEANNSTTFPATGGADFTAGRYDAIFTVGATTATISIPIIDDNIYEPNAEEFNLRLYIDGAGYQLGLYKGNISKATVSILEDTFVRFSQSMYTVDEANGVVQPVLVLSKPLINSNVTFNISAVSGTATRGIDYNSGPYSVTFPAGMTSVLFDIQINDDNIIEGNESFTLNIINSSGITASNPSQATVIIRDDDLIVEFASGQFVGSESSGFIEILVRATGRVSSVPITVTVTPSVQSPVSARGSGVDFDSSPLMITFAPGEVNKTVAIPVMCDRLSEGEEMFNINLNIISVSHNVKVELGLNRSIGIIIDSTVDVTFAKSTYTITEDIISLTPLLMLSQSSPVSLQLFINLIDVTTTEEDYDQRSILVSVAPGTMAHQFTVNITNDNTIECTETFNLSISIEKTLCGLSSNNDDAQVIIIDDDVGAVNIMQPPLLVTESAGSLEINLLLNATASKDVTILTTMMDITASVGLDYSQNGLSSQLASSVNIISGLMSGLLRINIIDNTIQESNETFNVALQLQSSCLPINLIGEDSFTITIVDDEELTVEFNQTMYHERETSGIIIITLNLLGGTASVNFNVSVSTSPVTATENLDYDTATLTATFLAGSTIATVEISIIDDTVVNEEDEVFNLTLNLLPTTDVRVMPGIHSTATVTIIDTTRPQIYIHPMNKIIEINNNSATATFNCMAYGASSYYWLRETGNIPSNAMGIKSNTLILHNILPPDNGKYQCIAENEHGKTFSNYAMFTVKALPPVVSIVSEREVKVKGGERAEFVCSATGVGTDNFIYKWYLNDLPVAGQDKPTLVIVAVSEDNTGDYKCFVRNQYNGVGESEVAKLILDRYCNSIPVKYTGFSVIWNETLVGSTVEAPCTGPGLNGTVRRRCVRDDQWEEFFECFKEETAMLLHQATNLTLSINELNETEKITKTSNIANALVNITDPTQEPIFAQDINLAVNIVSTLNNITETIVANLTADDALFEDTASVIDNLLSDTNRDSWKQLERTSPSTSQALVSSAEQVSKLLSEALTNNTTEAIKIKSNIVIKAERISNDSVDNGYSFPDEKDNLTAYGGGRAQLMVPGGLLQDITAGSKQLTIASTVIRNGSGLRLPSSNNKTVVPQVPASPIFSLQINPLPDPNVLAKNPIMLMFDVDLSAIVSESEQSGIQNKQDFTIDDLTCNFYDYTLITNENLNQIGGWSTEGLTVDKNHSTTESVTCLTTHLTSFAVLVSIQDERPPSTADKALSIISYIGCSISLACLCISIAFLSYAIYKTRDKKNLLFIHLNLCIALALGLVVFIAGIENATSNEIGCKFVAALLQYLFISAFCWMLCEGVMLYMMLVTVFGNKLNKRRFFFALGWGPAIPIVAISVGIVHTHYGTDHYCWIKSDDGAIAAFIVPIVAIMLVNCIFFVITLKVLCVNQQQIMNEQFDSNKDIVKDLLKAMIVLLPLLGLTWIIGIFAVNNETQVFAWIFAILNSLQGVFIFIFHVIRNKQVIREMRERYNLMKRSDAFRRLLSVRGGTGSTSTLGISSKARTSQSTSSEVSGHGKKISTTSFGNSSTSGEYLSATLEKSLKDKSELFEDSVFVEENDQMKLTTFKKLEECIMEECDAGTERKTTIKDGTATVTEKKNTTPTVKEKPVSLPRITK